MKQFKGGDNKTAKMADKKMTQFEPNLTHFIPINVKFGRYYFFLTKSD